jgi:hypothetical protein
VLPAATTSNSSPHTPHAHLKAPHKTRLRVEQQHPATHCSGFKQQHPATHHSGYTQGTNSSTPQHYVQNLNSSLPLGLCLSPRAE